jgi:uncharacterized protein (TIGR00730 family)
MKIRKVCVYCASSRRVDSVYYESAKQLGEIFAMESITVIYGGGSVGLMGALADGCLSKGGKVIGVIPQFMYELEWGHKNITELRIVENMHQRKQMMIEESDAIVALPGGSGTLEELLEAITWKRLGLHFNPIILLNTRGFFNPLIQLLENCINEGFMDVKHKEMWQVVNVPENVMNAMQTATIWPKDARNFASI